MPRRYLFTILVLLVGLSGCGNPGPTAVDMLEATAPPVTASPIPNATSAPTTTAMPIATVTAIATAAPSATSLPSPVATASPVPTDPTGAILQEERPLVPTAAPTAVQSRAAPSQPARIVIDAITLDRLLVPVGLDARRVPIVPKHDIGWFTQSAMPGQGENVVLWGHVLRFSDAPSIPAPFARLQEVTEGSRIMLYTADGVAHEYVVTQRVWATPDQVEFIMPVGSERLTLVSCIGDKIIVEGQLDMSHRLITIAERV